MTLTFVVNNKSMKNSEETRDRVAVALADIAEIVMGQSPPSDTYNESGKGLPFFQGKAEFTDLHPQVRKWCSVPGKIAEPSDILISVRAPVGATNVADQRCCIGRGLAAIRYPQNTKFILYFLRLIERELDEQGTGTTFRAISGEQLRNVSLQLPPLLEQHAIVSKLEQLFSELDKGIESLKTAQQQLKVYRQSVLKWAFEGKLTAEWRKNQRLADAGELLAQIQKEREEKARESGKKLSPESERNAVPRSPLPDGWVWAKIADICPPNRKCSYGVLVPGNHVERGVPLVRVGDIDSNGNLRTTELKQISAAIASKYQRTFLQGGEVLITLVGAIGRTTVAPESVKGANIARAVGVIPVSEKLNARYIELMLRSPGKIQEHNSAAHEVARKTLNLEDVEKSMVPLCSQAEQAVIVSEVDSYSSVCDVLDKTIVAALDQSEALRQSILKKAFEGRLLQENELEALRRDPAWEPADKLLQRIRDEQANSMNGTASTGEGVPDERSKAERKAK